MFSLFQNIFYNRSLGRLRQMLESLRSKDFCLRYSLQSLRGEERRLAEEINAVVQMLREEEHQHERQVQFFEALLSTVPSMLIATDEAGAVRWMNAAAVNGLCGFRIAHLNQLGAMHPDFPNRLRALRKGTAQLLSFTNERGEAQKYSAVRSLFFSKGFAYHLYALDHIETVVQQSEIEAQQHLVRVMNHEIMNSLSPIISLSQTLAESLQTDADLTAADARMALEAIHRRAEGLLTFVNNYRKLSGVPQPVLAEVDLEHLLADLRQLVKRMDFAQQPQFTITNQCGDVRITIDRTQMEQVLINLLKNAAESGATKVVLNATFTPDERQVQFSVTDNGGGFAPEALNHLFTPFFTTKQGGQGIGLALCKQMVNNHGGTITAQCLPGADTCFVVKIPL